MSEKFILSHRIMQLLMIWLQKDLLWSEERRDMFEEACIEHKIYQNAVDEDKKLIKELDKALKNK